MTAKRTCLFCENIANSREHLWPDWILKRFSHMPPIRHAIGSRPPVFLTDVELKSRTVCATCNKGWMSKLESASIPVLGCLMEDISLSLDSEQQNILALWAIKTAIVFESTSRSFRQPHHSEMERAALRSGEIPVRANIWIGRFTGRSLGTFGTDITVVTPNIGRVGSGAVTTIVVGHLAIQYLAFRPVPQYRDATFNIEPKPGPWNDLLVPISPNAAKTTWPPKLTFSYAGMFRIGMLHDRWRIGTAVSNDTI